MRKISEIVADTPLLSMTACLETGKTPKPVSNPQQVLILLLKSYSFVSDDFIVHAAPAIGVNVEKLTTMFNKVHELCVERDEKILRLKEQLHVQYYRCMSYRKQLEALSEHSSQRELLRGYLEQACSNYTITKQQLASINLEPSNRQIAEVLGIPKGVVDSTLRTLKRKTKRVNDKARN
ncbi:MAG: hypothetical protein LBK00_03190 [Treponema sp.]|jgi:hypothetical protein|nr:hypothetical protein [Treponema sp.]